MDPSIILAGQPVNVLGALGGGVQLAANAGALNRQGQYNALLREHGAGIMAGDQTSLNALAQFDPQAALGVQSSRLGMDATRQNMGFAAEEMGWKREAIQRETEAWAAQQDAATVAAERERLANGLKGAAFFYQQGDRAGYDRFLTENGVDPAMVPFDQFPAQAATFEGVLDVLDKFKPTEPKWRVATPEEAARYGATGGQINAETGEFKAINPPSGMSIRTNPDGTMEMVQGAGAGGRSFTEAQGKDVVYATRAEGALATLDPIADSLASLDERAADSIPLGMGSYLQSPDYQVAQTAGSEFLAAILRKDTGAAITEGEQRIYGDIYLPRPGDTPERLAYKKAARQRALAALKSGMSAEQIAAQERALASGQVAPFAGVGTQEQPAPAAQPAPPPASGDGWIDFDGVKVRVKP